MATVADKAVPTPAMPPPPGVTPNFDSPESLKGMMDIAIGVAIPLTTIFFTLRTYVRVWIKEDWTIEDWLALIAWIGTVAFCGTGAATMAHHGGEHQWDMTRSQASEVYYWLNVARIQYGFTICIAKLAILCLYRRIFKVPTRSTFDITVIALMVLLVLFYVPMNMAKIFECIPRAKIWDNTVPGHCIDTYLLLNVSGVFNTVSDFVIVMLPLGRVWNLRMPLRKKAYVVFAFTFGMCAPAFSLVGSVARLKSTNDPDKTRIQPEIVMWGLAELATGILCVSFPEIGVLLRGRVRRRSTEASTGIREGRYREQDAALNYPRHRTPMWIADLAAKSSISPMARASGGMTSVAWARADGSGRLHSQLELDEMNLITRPEAAFTIGSKQRVQHYLGKLPGDIEVTREVRVDSSSMV